MEKWKVIRKFPNYAVSNQGRVKRITPGNGTYAGKILKLQKHNWGYYRVGLRNEKQTCMMPIHTLVLKAFTGPRPFKYVGNHKSGIKTENWIDNLEWVTVSEDRKHAYDTGLRGIGEKQGGAKLKEGEVWLIKRILAAKVVTQRRIAYIFKISYPTITDIKGGKTWGHIRLL